MGQYHVDNGLAGTQQAMASTYKSVLEGLAQTTGLRRLKIFGFNIGPSGLPSSTDCDLVWDISRCTATGTGTTITPVAIDPADGVAHSVWEANTTIEGTVTATSSLKYGAMNQRATFSWQTNDASQMLIGPATNNAGFVMRAKSSTMITTVGASIEFMD